MYIKDDICYADIPCEDKKVIECKPLEGKILLLTFSDGIKKLFDCSSLKGSAFSRLKDDNIFKNVKLFHGFPTWDNGNIDIAPEVLYEEGIDYNEFNIISSKQLNKDITK